MKSVLCCCLLFLVSIAFVTGAPSQLKCPDSDLDIPGATFTLSDGYNEDSILRYRCSEGYYPYPAKKRECSKGNWKPPPSKRQQCRKVTCPNPKVLVNGEVEPYKQQYFVNDTTTYKCNSDYTFRGSSQRVCQINGKWSGRTPICSRDSDHCRDPGTPPGAHRTGHIFNIDDKVTYRCDDKLKLVGSKDRVCMDGGQWSGQEPECYAHFTYDTPAEVAEAFGSTLKTTISTIEQPGQEGKKIKLDQKGKLNIFVVLDTSDSIDEEKFDQAKQTIITLMEKISYYEVFPNYEIIIFASKVSRIGSIAGVKKADEKSVADIMEKLKNYSYDEKGTDSGTNVAAAFNAVWESMKFQEVNDKAGFLQTQHVIIMFTDGEYNMGGNPVNVIKNIKQLVYQGDEVKRDEYLDIYVFGVGEEDDVQKAEIDEWVTKRPNEKHYFLLKNLKEVQQTFDEMIDESTSVGLCGLYRDYDEESDETRRRRYPWMIQINVMHADGVTSNCLGSLVTPSFVLTAAHCFKFGDVPENVDLRTPSAKATLKVKDFMLHPDYNTASKKDVGVKENYQYDVALIQLENGIHPDASLRPICIPCTKETSGALRLFGSDVSCAQHRTRLLQKDLEDAFFMSIKKDSKGDYPKNNVQIKLGHKTGVCIADVVKHLGIDDKTARELIENNFLCTGGVEPNTVDKVSCKGDSGGATFLQQSVRAFQVGVVSWGLKDPCKDNLRDEDYENTRDFHVDLFNPKVQDFLETYLGDEERGAPLKFIP